MSKMFYSPFKCSLIRLLAFKGHVSCQLCIRWAIACMYHINRCGGCLKHTLKATAFYTYICVVNFLLIIDLSGAMALWAIALKEFLGQLDMSRMVDSPPFNVL